MITIRHITRIIERLDPVDREALEQHLTDGESRHRKLIQCLDDNAMVSRDRDELAAQSAVFRDHLQRIYSNSEEAVMNDESCYAIVPDYIDDISDLLDSPPAACLAEIKAQAIEQFAKDELSHNNVESFSMKNVATRYADRIRKEVQ